MLSGDKIQSEAILVTATDKQVECLSEIIRNILRLPVGKKTRDLITKHKKILDKLSDNNISVRKRLEIVQSSPAKVLDVFTVSEIQINSVTVNRCTMNKYITLPYEDYSRLKNHQSSTSDELTKNAAALDADADAASAGTGNGGGEADTAADDSHSPAVFSSDKTADVEGAHVSEESLPRPLLPGLTPTKGTCCRWWWWWWWWWVEISARHDEKDC